MTYGQPTADLLTTLTALRDATAENPTRRTASGGTGRAAQVGRLRSLVARYAARLVAAALPPAADGVGGQPTDPWRPARRLAAGLQAATGDPAWPRPHPDDLTPGQDPVVAAWQDAARAAITASERELPALADLTPGQRRAMLRDADLILQALTAIDGAWHPAGIAWNPARQQVARYQPLVREWVNTHGWDSSVDHLGATNHTPRPTGDPVAATVWALEHLAATLTGETPSARAATNTAGALARIAAHTATLTSAEMAGWGRYAQAMEGLFWALQHVGSGTGSRSATAAAADAARTATTITKVDDTELEDLQGAFDQAATALHTAITRAAQQGVFHHLTGHKRLGPTIKGVRQAVATYEPLTAVKHDTLYTALRRIHPPHRPQPGDETPRTLLIEALTSMPPGRPEPAADVTEDVVPTDPAPGTLEGPGSRPVPDARDLPELMMSVGLEHWDERDYAVPVGEASFDAAVLLAEMDPGERRDTLERLANEHAYDLHDWLIDRATTKGLFHHAGPTTLRVDARTVAEYLNEHAHLIDTAPAVSAAPVPIDAHAAAQAALSAARLLDPTTSEQLAAILTAPPDRARPADAALPGEVHRYIEHLQATHAPGPRLPDGVPTPQLELVLDDTEWGLQLDLRATFPNPDDPGVDPVRLYVWTRAGEHHHEWHGTPSLDDRVREQVTAWAHEVRNTSELITVKLIRHAVDPLLNDVAHRAAAPTLTPTPAPDHTRVRTADLPPGSPGVAAPGRATITPGMPPAANPTSPASGLAGPH